MLGSDDNVKKFIWKSRRIAVLHLDSLCCLPALNLLFQGLGSRIGLVVSSDRVSDIYDLWRQLRRNAGSWGMRMTLALGFDIVALRVAAVFASPIRRGIQHWVRARRGKPASRGLSTLREHAFRIGAEFAVVEDINDERAIALLRKFQPDLVVSFHFDQILSSAVLEGVGCPVVNVHPSLLPAHRGPCPSFWTLVDADARCGVTVHIVDGRIDAGPVLARRERDTPPSICMTELDELLFCDGAGILLDLLSGPPGAIVDPPGQPAKYQTFPDAKTVHAALRRGVRLWRLSHAVRLISALLGWNGSTRSSIS